MYSGNFEIRTESKQFFSERNGTIYLKMRDFNDELLRIHQQISIRDIDRRPYTEMFETIRTWLMKEMCAADPTFKKMFKGTELFGSYPNRVRIIRPSEYDVLILLDCPFFLDIRTNHERPGFVEINSKEWRSIKDPEIKNTFKEMFVRRRRGMGLHRNRLQGWIQDLIEFVLSECRLPYGYSIEDYTPCSVAQNIYVKETHSPFRKISIDFVPSIVMHEEYITSLIEQRGIRCKACYRKTFLAIPKCLEACGNKNTRKFTFQLVNPVAERDIIWDKQNLKVVYRLLKSLRNNYKLPRLKSYFLTAIFLFEVDKNPAAMWQEPVSYIFFHMLEILMEYLDTGRLPFYWGLGYNLLSILRPEEVIKYHRILFNAYCRLRKISLNEPVSYSVDEQFKVKK